MRLTILAVAFCLESASGFAENWSGTLVDSKCFASEERNVSPTDTLTTWIATRIKNFGIAPRMRRRNRSLLCSRTGGPLISIPLEMKKRLSWFGIRARRPAIGLW